jgi:hypothetical protein
MIAITRNTYQCVPLFRNSSTRYTETVPLRSDGGVKHVVRGLGRHLHFGMPYDVCRRPGVIGEKLIAALKTGDRRVASSVARLPASASIRGTVNLAAAGGREAEWVE